MSGRTLRLVVAPAILFVLVSGTVFVLAQTHPAKDEGAAAPAPAAEGDATRGEQLFAESCESCHGDSGPRLAGSGVSIDEARATIENGSGVMPAGLVGGQELEDVLAYLETITG
jgi:mono/diheme cytochrome c family protein